MISSLASWFPLNALSKDSSFQIGSPLQDKHKISTLFRKMLDLKKIKVCRATHCPFSYCLSLEHIAGWKISYSGDTVISDTFIRIGNYIPVFL